MAPGLIGILVVVLIIFVVNQFSAKQPQTVKEIKERNREILWLLDYEYDFDKDINFQSADRFKRNTWYVSDCGEYYHVIQFGNNDIVMLASISKEFTRGSDSYTCMKNVEKQLNERNDYGYWVFDIKTHALNIKFPSYNDPNLLYRSKLKLNGVLVVRKRFFNKRENKVIEQEHQYLETKDRSFGPEWSLILRDNL